MSPRPESRHDPWAGRKLQELLDGSTKLPFVVALFVGVAIVFDLMARHHVRLWVLVLAGMLFGIAWFSRRSYQRRPDSLRAIFTMLNLGLSSVAVSALWVAWAARVVGGVQWLYDDYAIFYLVIFTTVLAVMAPALMKHWRSYHEQLQDLRTHLQDGTIPDDRLYYWFSHRGAQDKWPKARMAAIIGIAVTSTMLIGGFGGRDALGYFLFLVLLVGSPTVLAAIATRLWLQRKYLEGKDLRVVRTGELRSNI